MVDKTYNNCINCVVTGENMRKITCFLFSYNSEEHFTAIYKGMIIGHLQNFLGHVKIDTTMHYAMVNPNNVKIAH
nr:hypothetical protein [Methanobrevibacter sp.]